MDPKVDVEILKVNCQSQSHHVLKFPVVLNSNEQYIYLLIKHFSSKFFCIKFNCSIQETCDDKTLIICNNEDILRSHPEASSFSILKCENSNAEWSLLKINLKALNINPKSICFYGTFCMRSLFLSSYRFVSSTKLGDKLSKCLPSRLTLGIFALKKVAIQDIEVKFIERRIKKLIPEVKQEKIVEENPINLIPEYKGNLCPTEKVEEVVAPIAVKTVKPRVLKKNYQTIETVMRILEACSVKSTSCPLVHMKNEKEIIFSSSNMIFSVAEKSDSKDMSIFVGHNEPIQDISYSSNLMISAQCRIFRDSDPALLIWPSLTRTCELQDCLSTFVHKRHLHPTNYAILPIQCKIHSMTSTITETNELCIALAGITISDKKGFIAYWNLPKRRMFAKNITMIPMKALFYTHSTIKLIQFYSMNEMLSDSENNISSNRIIALYDDATVIVWRQKENNIPEAMFKSSVISRTNIPPTLRFQIKVKCFVIIEYMRKNLLIIGCGKSKVFVVDLDLMAYTDIHELTKVEFAYEWKKTSLQQKKPMKYFSQNALSSNLNVDIEAMKWCNDILIVGGSDGILRIIQLSEDIEMVPLAQYGYNGAVVSLQVSPSGLGLKQVHVTVMTASGGLGVLNFSPSDPNASESHGLLEWQAASRIVSVDVICVPCVKQTTFLYHYIATASSRSTVRIWFAIENSVTNLISSQQNMYHINMDLSDQVRQVRLISPTSVAGDPREVDVRFAISYEVMPAVRIYSAKGPSLLQVLDISESTVCTVLEYHFNTKENKTFLYVGDSSCSLFCWMSAQEGASADEALLMNSSISDQLAVFPEVQREEKECFSILSVDRISQSFVVYVGPKPHEYTVANATSLTQISRVNLLDVYYTISKSNMPEFGEFPVPTLSFVHPLLEHINIQRGPPMPHLIVGLCDNFILTMHPCRGTLIQALDVCEYVGGRCKLSSMSVLSNGALLLPHEKSIYVLDNCINRGLKIISTPHQKSVEFIKVSETSPNKAKGCINGMVISIDNDDLNEDENQKVEPTSGIFLWHVASTSEVICRKEEAADVSDEDEDMIQEEQLEGNLKLENPKNQTEIKEILDSMQRVMVMADRAGDRRVRFKIDKSDDEKDIDESINKDASILVPIGDGLTRPMSINNKTPGCYNDPDLLSRNYAACNKSKELKCAQIMWSNLKDLGELGSLVCLTRDDDFIGVKRIWPTKSTFKECIIYVPMKQLFIYAVQNTLVFEHLQCNSQTIYAIVQSATANKSAPEPVSSSIAKIALSPNGHSLVMAINDHTSKGLVLRSWILIVTMRQRPLRIDQSPEADTQTFVLDLKTQSSVFLPKFVDQLNCNLHVFGGIQTFEFVGKLGRFLVTCGDYRNNLMQIWDVKKWDLLKIIKFNHPINQIAAYSPKVNSFYSVGCGTVGDGSAEDTLDSYQLELHSPLFEMKSNGNWSTWSFSDCVDERGDFNVHCKLMPWTKKSDRAVELTTVAVISSADHLVAVGDIVGRVQIWNVKSRANISCLELGSEITFLTASGANELSVAQVNGLILQYDVTKTDSIVDVSCVGRISLAQSTHTPYASWMQLLNSSNGNAENRFLLIGTSDAALWFIDFTRRGQIQEEHNNNILPQSIETEKSRATLLSGSQVGITAVCWWENSSSIEDLEHFEPDENISPLSERLLGVDYLAVSGDETGNIKVWQPITGELLMKFTLDEGLKISVTALATHASRSTICDWISEQDEEKKDSARDVCYSPGCLLGSYSDGSLRLFCLHTQKLISRYDPEDTSKSNPPQECKLVGTNFALTTLQDGTMSLYSLLHNSSIHRLRHFNPATLEERVTSMHLFPTPLVTDKEINVFRWFWLTNSAAGEANVWFLDAFNIAVNKCTNSEKSKECGFLRIQLFYTLKSCTEEQVPAQPMTPQVALTCIDLETLHYVIKSKLINASPKDLVMLKHFVDKSDYFLPIMKATEPSNFHLYLINSDGSFAGPFHLNAIELPSGNNLKMPIEALRMNLLTKTENAKDLVECELLISYLSSSDSRINVLRMDDQCNITACNDSTFNFLPSKGENKVLLDTRLDEASGNVYFVCSNLNCLYFLH